MNEKKVCIVGASGKLGKYMVRLALDRGYQVVGVCRESSIGKLDEFKARITITSKGADTKVIRFLSIQCLMPSFSMY